MRKSPVASSATWPQLQEDLYLVIAVIGFAYDTYALLVMPLIARPALGELLGVDINTASGTKAVLDIGNWGSAIFKAAPAEQTTVLVDGFGFAIAPWNAKTVEAELRKRDLNPVADNDGKGFESFHVKDPDGFDLQIGNSNGLLKARKTPATAKLEVALPFEATGWQTVWLDHFSFGATNYKASVSYYSNLLGREINDLSKLPFALPDLFFATLQIRIEAGILKRNRRL